MWVVFQLVQDFEHEEEREVSLARARKALDAVETLVGVPGENPAIGPQHEPSGGVDQGGEAEHDEAEEGREDVAGADLGEAVIREEPARRGDARPGNHEPGPVDEDAPEEQENPGQGGRDRARQDGRLAQGRENVQGATPSPPSGV